MVVVMIIIRGAGIKQRIRDEKGVQDMTDGQMDGWTGLS